MDIGKQAPQTSTASSLIGKRLRVQAQATAAHESPIKRVDTFEVPAKRPKLGSDVSPPAKAQAAGGTQSPNLQGGMVPPSPSSQQPTTAATPQSSTVAASTKVGNES